MRNWGCIGPVRSLWWDNSGRDGRLPMIQLSTPITIPSKMKILCTAPWDAPALCSRNGPLPPPYVIQTSRGRRNMPGRPKHPSLLHTKRPPDTHSSTRLHKSACQPPHHKVGWSRSGRAPGQSEGERGGGRRDEE